MLSLTRKTDYALVALCHLARRPAALSSAREIAETYSMPLPILMNILKLLARHGMVRSARGSRGGYGLAGEPAGINLHMIISAVEGPVRLFACADADDGSGGCAHEGLCPIKWPARRLSGRFQAFLEGLSLAEIVADQNTPVFCPSHADCAVGVCQE